jgi:hypothetical protein
MSIWFTETAWPPIMILATVAGAGVAMFFTTQRVKYLAALAPLLVLGPVIYAYEQKIVTERERVEQAITGVTSAFERHELPETLVYFSANAFDLRMAAAIAMKLVQPTGPLNVTDVSVTMSSRDSRATSYFRVNGPITTADFGDVGHRTSRWELTWQKEGGEWRIVRVQRLDPISGEGMDMMARSERNLR